MRTTEFYAEFALYDTTAREDAAFSTSDNQSFGNISMAKDDIDAPDYATLEEDFFILDGSKKEMPDSPEDVVYMSAEISDKDGTFYSPPSFIINFSENHTSYGLTFHFINDPPLDMEITWYDLAGVRISKKTFSITGNKYFAQNQVENYGKLLIRFIKAHPYRYVKFRYIEYGTDIVMGEGGYPVKDASLIEEVDPISDKIPINKLSYKFIDIYNNFDIGNLSGIHRTLQNGQECMAYEYVNGVRTFLGRFFLSDYGSKKNVTSMKLVDYKGILDNNRFLGGKVYNGEPAGNIIDAIMNEAGISDYTVTDDVRKIPLYGWLKIQTCRKALREVLFACGAVVSSERSMLLSIYIPEKNVKKTLHREQKFSTEPYIEDYISDVTIKYQQYELQDKDSQVLKGEYPSGTHTVELSNPATGMTINSGMILEQSENYVKFRVDSTTDVIITGRKYNKEEISITESQKNVEAGNTRNAKKFSSTVLSAKQAKIIAEKILDYYQYRLRLKIKYLYDSEMPAQWAEVDNSVKTFGNYVAVFEKLTTDLTGGYISNAQLRGYYNLIIDHYYAGELFGGDDMGDI